MELLQNRMTDSMIFLKYNQTKSDDLLTDFLRDIKKKQRTRGNVNNDRPNLQSTFESLGQILSILRDERFSRNRVLPCLNPAHAILLRRQIANLYPKNWGSFNIRG